MCFFKKKKKIEINSKYKLDEFVNFKYRDDMKFGRVYKISLDDNGNVVYSVQIGGECPVIIDNISESALFKG